MGRARRAATVALAVVVVVGIAVVVPRMLSSARGSSRSAPHAAAAVARPSRPPTSSVAPLGRLTKRVPCPVPLSRHRLAGFAAVTAVSCDVEQRTIGGAVWAVAFRRVAVAGVPALARALSMPSQPRGGADGICLSYAQSLGPLILVDRTGRFVAPLVPVDSCGHPLRAVLRADRAVTWRVVSARKLRMVVTPRAYAAGCPMEWKNEIWLEEQPGARRSAGGPVIGPTPRQARVCVYRVPAADQEVGSFLRGRKLGPADVRRLLPALELPGLTGPCPALRTFAVVSFDAGRWVNVEIGGCWRVLREDPISVGRADPAVAAAFLGRG